MGLFDGYKPDTSGGGDDLEVTWLNLKELATKHNATNPLVVEGTKAFFKTKASKFDTAPGSGVKKTEYMLIIKTSATEAVGVSGSSTMFLRECDQAGVAEAEKGEPVALLYAGKTGESKNGAFHWIEVRTEKNKDGVANPPKAEKIPF